MQHTLHGKSPSGVSLLSTCMNVAVETGQLENSLTLSQTLTLTLNTHPNLNPNLYPYPNPNPNPTPTPTPNLILDLNVNLVQPEITSLRLLKLCHPSPGPT